MVEAIFRFWLHSKGEGLIINRKECEYGNLQLCLNPEILVNTTHDGKARLS